MVVHQLFLANSDQFTPNIFWWLLLLRNPWGHPINGHIQLNGWIFLHTTHTAQEQSVKSVYPCQYVRNLKRKKKTILNTHYFAYIINFRSLPPCLCSPVIITSIYPLSSFTMFFQEYIICMCFLCSYWLTRLQYLGITIELRKDFQNSHSSTFQNSHSTFSTWIQSIIFASFLERTQNVHKWMGFYEISSLVFSKTVMRPHRIGIRVLHYTLVAPVLG